MDSILIGVVSNNDIDKINSWRNIDIDFVKLDYSNTTAIKFTKRPYKKTLRVEDGVIHND